MSAGGSRAERPLLPLVKGGQGRSGESLTEDARGMGYVLVFVLGMVLGLVLGGGV